jgi:hypothetical protein
MGIFIALIAVTRSPRTTSTAAWSVIGFFPKYIRLARFRRTVKSFGYHYQCSWELPLLLMSRVKLGLIQ